MTENTEQAEREAAVTAAFVAYAKRIGRPEWKLDEDDFAAGYTAGRGEAVKEPKVLDKLLKIC